MVVSAGIVVEAFVSWGKCYVQIRIFPYLSQQLHHKYKVYMEVKVLREVKGEKYMVKHLLGCLISPYIIIISLNNCASIFSHFYWNEQKYFSTWVSQKISLPSLPEMVLYMTRKLWYNLEMTVLFSLKYSFLYTKWKQRDEISALFYNAYMI